MVALWEGWSVHRYTAEGRLIGVVDVPAERVTSCAFGGENLDELYITTWRGHLGSSRTGDLNGAEFEDERTTAGVKAVSRSENALTNATTNSLHAAESVRSCARSAGPRAQTLRIRRLRRRSAPRQLERRPRQCGIRPAQSSSSAERCARAPAASLKKLIDPRVGIPVLNYVKPAIVPEEDRASRCFPPPWSVRRSWALRPKDPARNARMRRPRSANHHPDMLQPHDPHILGYGTPHTVGRIRPTRCMRLNLSSIVCPVSWSASTNASYPSSASKICPSSIGTETAAMRDTSCSIVVVCSAMCSSPSPRV